MQAAAKGAKVRRVDIRSSYVFFDPLYSKKVPRESTFIGKKSGRYEDWFSADLKDFTAEWEVMDEEKEQGND